MSLFRQALKVIFWQGFQRYLPLENVENLEMPQCNLLHSEVHKQTIHTGLKHYFGHCYQLFSCLRIRLTEGKKELTSPWLYFVMKQFAG